MLCVPWSKFVGLMLLPALLIAQIACTCQAAISAGHGAPSTSTTSLTCACGDPQSSCCTPASDGEPSPAKPHDCSHCGDGTELAVLAERFNSDRVAAPQLEVVQSFVCAWFLSAQAAPSHGSYLSASNPARLPPPPDLLRVKCALLI